MWNPMLLTTVAVTAGMILLAYVGAEVAYRKQERLREQHHKAVTK